MDLEIAVSSNVHKEDEEAVVAATFLRAALRSLGGDQENEGRRGRGSCERKFGFLAGNHGGNPARASWLAWLAQHTAREYNESVVLSSSYKKKKQNKTNKIIRTYDSNDNNLMVKFVPSFPKKKKVNPISLKFLSIRASLKLPKHFLLRQIDGPKIIFTSISKLNCRLVSLAATVQGTRGNAGRRREEQSIRGQGSGERFDARGCKAALPARIFPENTRSSSAPDAARTSVHAATASSWCTKPSHHGGPPLPRILGFP